MKDGLMIDNTLSNYESKKQYLLNSRFSSYKLYKYSNSIGYDVFCRRRRYPTVTYTWCVVMLPTSELLSLGDPWPCVTPKQIEIIEAIGIALKNHATN